MNCHINRQSKGLLFIAMLLCQTSFGQDSTTGSPRQPPVPSFQRTLESLESGLFPAQHALLIFQNGQLLLEKYWPGEDLVYGVRKDRDFGPEDLHGTRSCTKSVVGLLVGIAIHDGVLPSIDTPAFELFGDLGLEAQKSFSDAHRAITLKHLLTMTDGLDWQQHESKDHVNNESKLEGSIDAASYVWAQPMKRAAGTAFNYNSGATALLARALQRAAGKDIEQYAAEKLFGPLQIENWEWLQDSDGAPAAHFGLRLTPRDMLKIGQLVLQDGKWQGEQIVSQAWIKAMSDRRNPDQRYGYHWWLEKLSVDDATAEAVVAYGKGGQTIFVLPQQDAVVVLTAGHYHNNRAAAARTELLQKVILPELMLLHR